MEVLQVIILVFSLACLGGIWAIVYQLIKAMAIIERITVELRKTITVLAPNLNFEGEADQSHVEIKKAWDEHAEEGTD